MYQMEYMDQIFKELNQELKESGSKLIATIGA